MLQFWTSFLVFVAISHLGNTAPSTQKVNPKQLQRSFASPLPSSEDQGVCDFECGKINPTKHRITNGTLVHPHKYPWIAKLPGCTGTIISKRHVLSALHCGKASKLWIERDVEAGTSIEMEVIDHITHELYGTDGKDYEVLILVLKEEIKFSDTIAPICLPTSDQELVDGKEAVAVGWGQLGVQEATMKLWSHKRCQDISSSSWNITEVWLCAKGDRQSPCSGDSGGPLSTVYDGRHVEVGIASFVVSCSGITWPTYYVNIYHLAKWFKNNFGPKLLCNSKGRWL